MCQLISQVKLITFNEGGCIKCR